jgi:asparagine synthase (glutamine-hydrolysing)
MCGIAGVVSRYADRERFSEGLSKISYRGPDETGIFESAFGDMKIFLGVNRLSIIDIEGGRQPVFSEDKKVVAVFNGEIYNFLELREKLKQKHVFVSRSDSEIIPHLWEDYSEDMLDKLDGMFAIALYDREKEVLFLARDPFGEKPLYYSFGPDFFAFSSEPKVLFDITSLSPEPDFRALQDYLFFGFIPAPSSAFSGIKKLPAGYFLILDIKRWSLDVKRYFYIKKLERIDRGFALELLEYEFRQSVKRRLIADVPLGIFLSGGVDSSSVVAVASEFTKPKTFSISFSESSYDESEFSREVADFFGTEHTEFKMEQKDMLSVIPEIFDKLDEPFADSSILPTFILSKLTRTKVKVALSGDGGDELFGGYPTYISHIPAEIFKYILPQSFIEFLNSLSGFIPASFEYFSFDFKVKRFLSGLYYDLPQRHYFWMRYFSPEEINFIIRYGATERYFFSSVLKDFYDESIIFDFFSRPMYLDVKIYLQDDILFKTDRASSFCSLEVRTPFLTKNIANIVFSLDFFQKVRPFYTLDGLKFLLRRIMKGKLPNKILKRKKQGFAVPISFWILEHKNIFYEKILNLGRYLRKFGVLSGEYERFISKEFEDHIQKRENNSRKIYAIFSLSYWFERWIKV